MLQRRFASGQPKADFAQRVHMRHLAKQHSHELFPAGEPLGAELGLMLLDSLCEMPAWKKLQKLRIHTAYWCHGSPSLLCLWSCPRTHSRVTGISPQPHSSSRESYQSILDSNDITYA